MEKIEHIDFKGNKIYVLDSREFFATPEHMRSANKAPRFNNFHLLFATEKDGLYNSKLQNKKLKHILEQFKKLNSESYTIINHHVECYRKYPNWWQDIEQQLYYAYVFFRLYGATDEELFI